MKKIDIIEYSEDPVKFIANALAQAKVLSIELHEEENKASVKVSSDKLSLAIVRLDKTFYYAQFNWLEN